MIPLTPDEVKHRSGPLISQILEKMGDERSRIAENIRKCHIRGTIAHETANRKRVRTPMAWFNRSIRVAGLYGKPL
jgi:hypothetical protein